MAQLPNTLGGRAMKLPLPETIRSLAAHGWRVLCSDREQVHVTSGERHCILIVNGDYNRTPHHMLYVVATRYAPTDVMSGALAALDELTIAKGAR